jgi:hypothetical protein
MPDARTRNRRALWPWPGAAGALLLALAAAVAATGGAEWSSGALRLRVHDPWRLFGAGILLTGISAWIGGRRFAAALDRAWDARERRAWIVAAAAAVAVACAGIAWGTWSAGSADAYGYVSQAFLWMRGVPIQAEPLASNVPWPHAEWSLSPLGYRPGLEPGTIVPTYAPGLPLTMALAAAAGGPAAVYFVVPLLGAAAVWLAYLLGRRYAGGASGAAAAVLLAASPAFLYQVVQPMSDVPVTAWWLLALWGAAASRPFTAGCGAALAVLTRPNLAPVAAVVTAAVVLHAYDRPAGPRAAARAAAARACTAFLAPVGVAVMFLAWVNATLYGSPFASGYGTASELFAAGNIAPNAIRYTRWLIETHTPLILVCLAAPLAGRLFRGNGPALPAAAWSWIGLAFACIVVLCYLPYAVFDDWWYLRFLLPAIAVALVLSTAVWDRIAAAAPAAWRVAVMTSGIVLLATVFVATARQRDAFQLRRFESRYAAAGAFASANLPAGAVLVSLQESGALRLYGGRATIRFDYIDSRGLDAAVEFLDRSGRQPYFALESWEEDQFKDRFAPHSLLGRLDWPPMAEVGRPVRVRFYDPRDRAGFLADGPVTTTRDRRDMPPAR